MTEFTLLPTREILRRWLEAGAPTRGELATSDDGHHDKIPNVYHASSVWYCHRQKIYEERGLKPSEPKPLGLFEMGKAAEQKIFHAYVWFYGRRHVFNDLYFEKEVDGGPENGGFLIVGESDPVLFEKNHKALRVVEVKSSQAKEPKSKATHMHQGAFYANLLGTELAICHPGRSDLIENMPDDTVISKGDVDVLFEETVDYFREHHKNVQSGELPPASPKESGQCDFCEFRGRCQTDGGWIQIDHTLKSGPRKGQIEKRWVLEASNAEV